MPSLDGWAFCPSFLISFAKYNLLLENILSTGGMPLRLKKFLPGCGMEIVIMDSL